MKKTTKEKTNKIYLAILCGLLVSGAIVCSTNGNGDGNGGGGENSESPFVCTNGQEVTDSNTTEGENIQNCASCDAGFTPTPVSGNTRTTCEPDSGFSFVCEDGTPADGISATENVGNCATCTTGFTPRPVSGNDRMTCEQNMFVCTNGTEAEVTADNLPTTFREMNCASCASGFTETSQTAVSGNTRTTCEPDSGFVFVCEDGTPANGTSDTADVENCATCTTPGFTTEPDETVASRLVCRTPYVCPNGTAVVDTITTANVENCSACNTAGFTLEADGTLNVCRTPYVCPNGTIESGTTTMANVENCASCNTATGFSLEADGTLSVCRAPYVCTNGTAVVDTITTANVENCASCNTATGFSLEADGTLNVCRAPYVCPNGTIESGTITMANVENCASCNTDAGFTIETSMSGSEMVCRAPYVCPNGTIESGTTTTANVENCDSCNEGFGEVAQGERTTCQPEFTCPSGTEITETRPAIAMAGVENCSACDPGFGNPMAVAGSNPARSICSGNNLPIALWNAGRHQGNFSFGLCQTKINTGSADTIGSELRGRGYTKAVFFGSTGTGAGDYLFINIGSDTDALALPAMGGGSVSGRNIVVFTVSSGTVSVMNTFGSTPVTRTLGQVTDVATGGGFRNGGADVVRAAGVINSIGGTAWSFTNDREFASPNNCNLATSNSSSGLGNIMNAASVDGVVNIDSASPDLCNNRSFVLCVAR